MSTVAKERTSADAPAAERGDVVAFSPPRLPYHDAIKERFGIDKSGWKALVEAVFPAAKTADSVVMALSYCKARGLDPFKKPVHIVPMWDSRRGDYVETVWPGIAELRTTAFRTGQYAGCDEAVYGETVKQTFTGKVKVKGNWEARTVEVEFPSWCRITVYRDLHGKTCKFVGPKVKWTESYATIGSSDIPNEMWQSRPEGQLEKCAEAAALRKAFPEELGNQLTAEEMEGRRIYEAHVAKDITPPKPPAPPAPPSPPAPPATAPTIPHDSVVEAAQAEMAASTVERSPEPASDMPVPTENPEAWLKWLDGKLAGFDDGEAASEWWSAHIEPCEASLFPPDWEEAVGVWRKHERHW